MVFTNKIPTTETTTTILRHFFRDHPVEMVPEENFWTSWCKGRLTEADTPTIRLGATPSRLTSAHLHHPHPRNKKYQPPSGHFLRETLILDSNSNKQKKVTQTQSQTSRLTFSVLSVQ